MARCYRFRHRSERRIEWIDYQHAHINVGSYADDWSFTDSTGNYNNASGTVTDTIQKANAIISVHTYNVVYDGAWHGATGSVTGVNGALNGFTINSAHINAGSYADSWSFTDSTGNYNNASGAVTDTIQKANVWISVVGYNTFYNAVAHAATGVVYGVNGTALSGLNLGGTIHTNVGTYADTWTFTAPNSNYNNASGTVIDTITQSKSKMVRETISVPTTVKVKVTDRVLVNGKWVKKTVTVNETKMVKKTEMIKVYYN